MTFLRFLESIRLPFFDTFFSLVTHLGDEIGFMAIAVIVLWCADKRQGYYVLFTCFVGTLFNQVAKLAFRIERPWVKDPNFTIVESAREAATGYSFPSGHTQNAAGSFGVLAVTAKRKWAKIFWIALIFVVAFSRMYLGVHTPLDVGVSLGVGALLVVGFYPVFKDEESFEKRMPWLLLAGYLLTVGYVFFAFLFPDEIVGEATENLISAREAACTLHGAVVGIIPVYFFDKKYLHFETRAPWYAQTVKVVLGFAVVILIKSVLKNPLVFLCGGNAYVARVVRYFLIVTFSGSVWPLTFGWFQKWKAPALDAFGERVRAFFTNKKGTDTL